jgi:hypothetical protein
MLEMLASCPGRLADVALAKNEVGAECQRCHATLVLPAPDAYVDEETGENRTFDSLADAMAGLRDMFEQISCPICGGSMHVSE